METICIKRRIAPSKQVVIDLPQFDTGEEVELLVVVKPAAPALRPAPGRFDMAAWAEEWKTDLGADVRSTDVASFTGRCFR